jgi:hypothetical protein
MAFVGSSAALDSLRLVDAAALSRKLHRARIGMTNAIAASRAMLEFRIARQRVRLKALPATQCLGQIHGH